MRRANRITTSLVVARKQSDDQMMERIMLGCQAHRGTCKLTVLSYFAVMAVLSVRISRFLLGLGRLECKPVACPVCKGKRERTFVRRDLLPSA